MILTPLPHYFIVKVNNKQLESRREKKGELYISPDYTFMQNELQQGEIIGIGSVSKDIFPEAEIGDTLIFHHFITGKALEDNGENNYLLDDDGEFSYYNVTATEFNGERNLSFGIIKNGVIIPNKDYIFLFENKPQEVAVNESGLISSASEMNRDEVGDKMKELKSQVKELTKTVITDDLKVGIEKKEKEMNQLSKLTNKKEYKKFPVAFVNNYTKSLFNIEPKEVGILNMAANYHLVINEVDYIIAEIKYIAFAA